MTMFTGEKIEVVVDGDDFDGEGLVEADAVAMTIEIRTTTGTVVVAETAMTWDGTRLLWFYQWDTASPAVAAGSYRAKCKLEDADGGFSFEYKRIRLARAYF